MYYICPKRHYIPTTYGEVTRGDEKGRDGLTTDEREAARRQMMRDNGCPPRVLNNQANTMQRMQWAYEIVTARRCWYCGALAPVEGGSMNYKCVACGSGEVFVKHLDEPKGWHCINCAAKAGEPTALQVLAQQQTYNMVEELLFPRPLCTEVIQ